MKITKGVQIDKPIRVLIYGVEGIGKSTFASQFPDPLFIDTEGSTKYLDVARFEAPKNWEDIKEQVKCVINDPSLCKTLVIDTADWAETMCEDYVCRKNGKDGIEDFGYGKGYTYVIEEISVFMKLLNQIIDAGINVVMTAHALIQKFELPEETGAFDRYEIKIGGKAARKIAPVFKEWADMVLFANYRQYVSNVDGKNKISGGKRVMYTTHNPCYDAKNRFGLPDCLDFDYAQIGFCVLNDKRETDPEEKSEPVKEEKPKKAASKKKPLDELLAKMKKSKVTEEELKEFASGENLLGKKIQVKDFPEDFITGFLIGNWDNVVKYIVDNIRVPF